VSPDGKTLVIGDDAGTVHFLTLASGARVDSVAAHLGGVTAVDFTPSGRQVITSGSDTTSRVWELSTHEVVRTFSGHAANITAQAVSGDGSRLYTASSDGRVAAWDLAGTAGFGMTFSGVHNDPEFSAAFAFTPDGRSAAVAGTNGIVNIWSLRPLRRTAGFRAVDGIVAAVSFSPDGRNLLVAGDADPARSPGGGSLRIWSLRPQPRVIRDLHGLWRTLWAAYSPDGRTVAATGSPSDAPGGYAQSGQGDALVAEWNADSGRSLGPVVRLRSHGEAVAGSFAKSGRTLAVAQLGNWAALVDPARRRVLRRWKASSAEYLLAAASSPDGTRIATADFDGYLRVWRAATGQPVLPGIHVSADVLQSVAWSPDGSRLLTSTGDGSVHLHDARTGQPIGTPIITGSANLAAATYSPDGREIAAFDYSGRVWVYPATVDGWVEYACRAANRNLSRVEWAKYLPGRAYEHVCPAAR
jgi:WD40 repeat protein